MAHVFPQNVLHRYTSLHSVAFNMAVAHWGLTIYEDFAAIRYIVGSINEEALVPRGKPHHAKGQQQSLGYALFWSYIVHHVFAIGAFWFVQYTQELASMTTFGLLYEGPVIFATLRELISSFDDDLGLMAKVNRTWFTINWALTWVLYLLCRVPPTLTFLWYAWFYYSDVMVAEVSLPARVSFWIFGSVFSFISFYWMSLLAVFYADDQRKFAAIDAAACSLALRPSGSCSLTDERPLQIGASTGSQAGRHNDIAV